MLYYIKGLFKIFLPSLYISVEQLNNIVYEVQIILITLSTIIFSDH